MLVWLILRTLKYEFVTDLTVARYIWYLYYLPMLFIPLLGVYIALSLGKSEEYRLTERLGFWIVRPGTVFAGDHQRSAPAGICIQQRCAGRPDNYGYSHGPFYFSAWAGWLRACFFPCPPFEEKPRPQRQQKKDQAVCDSLHNGFVWALYLSGLPAIRRWLGDMNVTFCLLYAAIYESCIRCRMIQSNTGYVELFEATTLAACIADRSGNIVLRSRAAGEDMVCPKEGVPAYPAQRNTHLLGADQRRICRLAG